MSKIRDQRGEDLLLEMEANANAFNLKCLAVLCGVTVLCGLCNVIGIFIVEARTMRIAVGSSLLAFSLPILVWLIHDKLGKRTPSILHWSGFKILIVFSVYFGIMITSVALTFHAVLLMVLPGIFAAQYSDQKRLLKWMLIGSFILVPCSVYGGFFFGVVDRNFFAGIANKGRIPLEERIAICPPSRYLSLLTHYTIPRLLAIVCIDILLSGIGNRNSAMLEKQKELAKKAGAELRKRNELQSVVIENLSSLIESRDENTGEHVLRTKAYVGQLAREMERDEAFRGQLNADLIEEIAVDLVATSEPGYYDAILMDIQMPVMDGYEATRRIRSLEDKRLANIPILAMTANAFKEDVEAAKAAGMQAHIAKPIDVNVLMSALQAVLK